MSLLYARQCWDLAQQQVASGADIQEITLSLPGRMHRVPEFFCTVRDMPSTRTVTSSAHLQSLVCGCNLRHTQPSSWACLTKVATSAKSESSNSVTSSLIVALAVMLGGGR